MSFDISAIKPRPIDNISDEWVAALAQVHGNLFSDGWSEQDFIRFIENQSDIVIAAIDENLHILAGFLILRIVIDEAEILTIGVAADYQGRGVASLLCKDLLDTATKDGVKKIFLEVRADNVKALSLYEKQGFDLVATREGYYKNHKEAGRIDGLVMQKSI
ncbi:MAG: ribosomal protein S18-alanine N-acetyltransferase [Methyloligellaceae bacterium]